MLSNVSLDFATSARAFAYLPAAVADILAEEAPDRDFPASLVVSLREGKVPENERFKGLFDRILAADADGGDLDWKVTGECCIAAIFL